MLNEKKIRTILGSPVINVELTKEQIDINIELASKHADIFVKTLKCNKEMREYIFDKLVIIYCKNTLANSLNKYKGKLPDGWQISNHYYNSAKNDEFSLFQMLYMVKSHEKEI